MNLLRYINTVRYMRFSQLFNYVIRKFKITTVNLIGHEKLTPYVDGWIHPICQSGKMVSPNSFVFLNEQHDLITASDWNNQSWSKLWLYNLHYFDDLSSCDAVFRRVSHCMLIQRWIDENEPGHGNGWEPYPTSLRIVNWIKWSLAGNHLEKDWLLSLSLQVRYLTKNLETHLLGNHLFANAKALCFAGLFFDEGESDVWYRTGLQLIEREVIEQLCDDGGNFELSTMYHAIFLEDLLDLVNIHNAYNKDVPAGVENSIIPMLNWLHVMCHPDGEISFFNDAAHGIAPVVAELADYARRLGFVLQPVTGPLIDLPSSGYSRIEQVDVVAIIDRAAVGPDYLPGHAHADTLSFELSLFGERIVVNSGISVYGVGEQRMSERSTASHSTVFIDGQDSSEVWDGFRVARRANICKRFNFQNENSIRLIGCHDGYNRIKGKPQHCREWLFQVNSLEIIDRIGGAGVHEIVAVFPLHPDVVLQDEQDNRCTLYVKGKRIAVEFEGNGALDVLESSYHPQFGVSLDNLHLHYKVERELPIKITTRISW